MYSQFKKRAPRAVKAIKCFAQKEMRTTDVRLDVKLNQMVWAKGIRHIPNRVRVRMQRRRNEDENSKHKMYTLVSYVPVTTYRKLQTKTVDEA
jgi:large subunit ribosomal protein L31e